jgi:peptidoglycan/LPS O-acetylase OafA/YrhL
LLVAGIALIGWHRALLWHDTVGKERFLIYTRLDTRADSLLVGCMAGVAVAWNLIPHGRRLRLVIQTSAILSALLVLLLLVVVPSTSSFLYYGGFTAVAAAVATIIISLFHAPLRSFHALLDVGVLRWFGRLSYGLYLWHLPVYFLYDQLFPPFPVRSYTLRIFLPFIIKFAASVAVAALSFYFIEQPALRLKRRFGAETQVANRIPEHRLTATATIVPNE